MNNFSKFIGAIVMVAIVILTAPALLFGLGYFEGWLVKIVIGAPVANAFNVAFNTNYFTPECLPYIGGVLGWIGGFFKAVPSSRK